MLSLFNDFQPRLVLHAGLLIFGLAMFLGLVLLWQCPHCGWNEWVGEREAADDDEAKR